MNTSLLRSGTVGMLLIWAALVLTGCDPVAFSSSRDGILPDLHHELFVVHARAESIGVIDPRYAGTDPASWGEYLEPDSYTIAPGMQVPDLRPAQIYLGNDGNGVVLTGRAPNELTADQSTGRLYCVNSLSNSLSVIDESTLEVTREIDMGIGVNPWSLAIDQDDSSIGYVTGFVSNRVHAVDLDTGEQLWEVDLSELPSGSTGPEGIVWFEGMLYVGMTSYAGGGFGDGYIVSIDTADREVSEYPLEADGLVGRNPQTLLVDAQERTLQVICTGVNGGEGSDDGSVFIIGIDSEGALSHQKRLSLGGSPVVGSSSIDPLHRIVYAGGAGRVTSYFMGSAGEPARVLHGAADPIISDEGRLALFGGIAVDTQNGKLFVSDFPHDRILVLTLPEDPLTAEASDYLLLSEIPAAQSPQYLLLHDEGGR
ncbi:MAG: hypothetical protein K9L73_01590 [Spirochaetia bacterium]|nr:hypothetical protein [Spirochaetia bacterium]